MADALTKALSRSQGVSQAAYRDGMRMKADGGMSGQLFPLPQMTGLGGYPSRAKYQQRYNLFRGHLYAAVNALAMSAAQQPVNVGRLVSPPPQVEEERRQVPRTKMHVFHKMPELIRSKAAQRDVEVLEDDPLVKTMEKPNAIQDRWNLVYQFVANLNLTGWAYLVGEVTKEGYPAIYSVPTTWVTPVHAKEAFGSIRVRNKDKPADEGETFERGQFAFAYLPNPADPLGALAPTGSQMPAVRIDDHIQTSQEMFFQNGVFPSVIITLREKPYRNTKGVPVLTGVQRQQLESAVRRMWGSVANYGVPAVVDGIIDKIERLSMNNQEMGWDKSEDKVRSRILSAFGVHPFVLGEVMNVGGHAQASIIWNLFYNRVNSYLNMLSLAVTNLVGSLLQDESLVVWWDKGEARDESLYWANVNKARDRGDIDQDELRALLGFPPDEDKRQDYVSKRAPAIVQLLGQVGQGLVTNYQAAAVLEGMGLAPELAGRIAGQASEQASLQQATEELGQVMMELRSQPVQLLDGVVGLLKYNPYHDPASGRFTEGPGGGSFASPDTGGGTGGGGTGGDRLADYDFAQIASGSKTVKVKERVHSVTGEPYYEVKVNKPKTVADSIDQMERIGKMYDVAERDWKNLPDGHPDKGFAELRMLAIGRQVQRVAGWGRYVYDANKEAVGELWRLIGKVESRFGPIEAIFPDSDLVFEIPRPSGK